MKCVNGQRIKRMYVTHHVYYKYTDILSIIISHYLYMKVCIDIRMYLFGFIFKHQVTGLSLSSSHRGNKLCYSR